MQVLSATDAIGPAWQHTRRLMFGTGRKRTLFKLAALGFFAEIGGCRPGIHTGPTHVPSLPHGIVALLTATALLWTLIGLVIACGFFYLFSRLQLVMFDVVLRTSPEVAPSWRRVSASTWRWIGLKLLGLLATLVCLSPILVPMVIHLIHVFPKGNTAPPDLSAVFATIFGFMAVLILAVLFLSVCFMLLRDFSVPSLALENVTIGTAVRRILHLLRLETGQVLLYLLMSILMRIGGAIVIYTTIGFGTLIALVPLGGISLLLWTSLRHSGTGGQVLMYGGWTVCGLVLLTLIVIAGITLLGYMVMFLQAYTLYFLGGRYPLLGAFLETAPPQANMPGSTPGPLLTYPYPATTPLG